MDITSIARRLNELRLQRALQGARRARRAVVHHEGFDPDCRRCVRRASAAEARVRELEARLSAQRTH